MMYSAASLVPLGAAATILRLTVTLLWMHWTTATVDGIPHQFLSAGRALYPGQCLSSSDNHFRVCYGADGDIFGWDSLLHSIVWSIGVSSPLPGAVILRASDGRITAMDAVDVEYWSSNPLGEHLPALSLRVLDGGELAIVSHNQELFWQCGEEICKVIDSSRKLQTDEIAPSEYPTMEPTDITTEAPSVLPSSEMVYTTPTFFPTGELGDVPSLAPTEMLYESPTMAPSDAITDIPSEFPTDHPSGFPSRYPTLWSFEPPTFFPTTEGTDSPSEIPTELLSESPTFAPSGAITDIPTDLPTEATTSEMPTEAASEVPTYVPAGEGTTSPSEAPTELLSESPTFAPSDGITDFPTDLPTEAATEMPTEAASEVPTYVPTSEDTTSPSEAPTELLSESPTFAPSDTITNIPTEFPTEAATERPSEVITEVPTEATTDFITYFPTSETIESPSAAPTEILPESPTFAPSEAIILVPSELPTLDFTDMPSEMPFEAPSAMPSEVPFEAPSMAPSEALLEIPSEMPSEVPSETPSELPSETPSELPPTSRPTGNVWNKSPQAGAKNSLAFAAWSPDLPGSVFVWGNVASGGDSSVLEELSLKSENATVASIVGCKVAFTASLIGGGLVSWGTAMAIAGWERYRYGEEVLQLVATEYAFAGITVSGAVFAFGSPRHGGAIPEAYIDPLSSGVIGIAASKIGTFAAWKANGQMYTWGNSYATASEAETTQLRNVTRVTASQSAFAAIREDGQVVSWGNNYYGGCVECENNPRAGIGGVVTNDRNSSIVLTEVTHVIAANMVFIAVREDGSLASWGFAEYGGDGSSVAPLLRNQRFLQVATTLGAIAAVAESGEVVTWGSSKFGGDSTAVASQLVGIKSMVATNRAFAAWNDEGRVTIWGDANFGGSWNTAQAPLASGVKQVVASNAAFAALLNNGSVVAWGDEAYGGEIAESIRSYLRSDVVVLTANTGAFMAIRRDGVVVVWGNKNVVSEPLVDTASLRAVDVAGLLVL